MKTRIMQIGIAIIAMLALGIGIASVNRDSEGTTFASPGIIPNVDTTSSTAPDTKQTIQYANPITNSCWQVVSSPAWSVLWGVAAISSDDVWAVGADHSISPTLTLVEHWNGSVWSVIPSPSPGTHLFNQLKAVSAVSSSDVWAVGSYRETGNVDKTLIEHWNGSVWSVVPSPSPGTVYSWLNGVAAVSQNDVWAVGIFSSPYQILIEHWNGSAWSVASVPTVSDSWLTAVSVVSAGDVWAVGGYYNQSVHTLVLHWDGATWSVVPSPSLGSESYLNQVAAASSNDVWTVGSYNEFSGGTHMLIEHWDGATWSIIPGPEVVGDSELIGITAVSSTDIWAVGQRHPSARALLVHWDGITWSLFPGPDVISALNGVFAVSSDDIWAVGSGSTGTLIERYKPDENCPPVPTATATPEPPRCPSERFTDVCPSDYFYQHVLDLNDLGVLSGYNTIPPCAGAAHIPCFKPYNWTSRGQIAKIVSLAAGFNEPVTSQTFEDVPSTQTFYQYIERIAAHHVAGGYPCGSFVEPCFPGNRPYFRPANTVSRGQLAKMVVLAFDFNEPVSSQTFEDVPPTHTFYQYIERLAVRTIIQGYPCGDPGEPCNPGNRQYFRPGNPISRGQITKIVNLARTQPTTTPTPTVTLTSTPTNTPDPAPSETPTSIARLSSAH